MDTSRFHAPPAGPATGLVCNGCGQLTLLLGTPPPVVRCPCGAVLRDTRPDPLGPFGTLDLPPGRTDGDPLG